MTVEEALYFFKNHPQIARKLGILNKSWAWILRLGQSLHLPYLEANPKGLS